MREEGESDGPPLSEQLLQERIKVLELQLRLSQAGIREQGGAEIAANLTATRVHQASERFKGHESKYSGKSAAEYSAWVKALEHDHRYYTQAFQREVDKTHYAQRALVAGSKAAKHWQNFQDHAEDLESLTWDQMKEEMLEVLGSQGVRRQANFSKWLHAKWQSDPIAHQMYLESLEDQMEDPLPESAKLMHLWDHIPGELAMRVRALPEAKTRAELVNQLSIIIQDDKRVEALQSAGKKDSTDRSKPKGKSPNKKRDRSERSRDGKGKDRGSQSSPNPDSKRSKSDPQKYSCFNCGEKGHMANHCTNPARPAGAKAKEAYEARRARKENPNFTPVRVDQVAAQMTKSEGQGKSQTS
jgi:hypothetical protein